MAAPLATAAEVEEDAATEREAEAGMTRLRCQNISFFLSRRMRAETYVPPTAEPEAEALKDDAETETEAETMAEEEAEVKQEVSLPATTLIDPLHASLSLASNNDNMTPSLTGMLTSHSVLSESKSPTSEL